MIPCAGPCIPSEEDGVMSHRQTTYGVAFSWSRRVPEEVSIIFSGSQSEADMTWISCPAAVCCLHQHGAETQEISSEAGSTLPMGVESGYL